MSIRWCGMPRRCSSVSLSVPMSKPRYTAVESQLMISPSRRSASARPSALLPDAVGPITASTSGRTWRSNHEGHEEHELGVHAGEDVDRERGEQKDQPELLR